MWKRVKPVDFPSFCASWRSLEISLNEISCVYQIQNLTANSITWIRLLELIPNWSNRFSKWCSTVDWSGFLWNIIAVPEHKNLQWNVANTTNLFTMNNDEHATWLLSWLNDYVTLVELFHDHHGSDIVQILGYDAFKNFHGWDEVATF